MDPPMLKAAPGTENTIAVLLAEFQTLREEIFARFESQRQAFNYLMILLTAVIALFGSETMSSQLDLILFLPILVAPLAFIFFDNELIIWCIGGYIDQELKPRLCLATGEKVLRIEETRTFYLGKSGLLHLLLSAGRWFSFIIPTAIPIVCAYTQKMWQDWQYFVPFWLVFVIDCLFTLLLLSGIVKTLSMRLKSWPVMKKNSPHPQFTPSKI